MLNGKLSQPKGQGISQVGKGHLAPKSWKCAGVAGCGHAWNLPSTVSCIVCGLHWDFNRRPSLKGTGNGAGPPRSVPSGTLPVGAAAARPPWVKQQWTGSKGKGSKGSGGPELGALEKECGILAELLGEEHPEVCSRRKHISARAAGAPPSKAGLIKTCDELAAILGEEHAEVVTRRKAILEMPGDYSSSVPVQKQLQNVLRQLDGLRKKYLMQSAKLASLEEQKNKLQAEIDGSMAFVSATQGRIDDAETLKTSVLAKCCNNEGHMEVDGDEEEENPDACAFADIFNSDADLDPDHRDMFDRFIHLKDTLAKLAKSKQDERSKCVEGEEGLPPTHSPLKSTVGPPTKFGISKCYNNPGNSKAWPTPTNSKGASASSYGKAPAITHQRGMPFTGLQGKLN